ncbi:MAG: HAD family hydrolase [Gemmatimonadetes bacterium]|uniref:phosphoglycolate phosphatase n=1 Tax=Candidatus Kutchimonas denitrificans TaxID=3056748 RepID=A0AAE4Z9X5_9BACT|nr:HAD family hydrolase [Gemmatimonadota bacterium]NIR76479.1 HAD family hydrolase [Candidatus Kutchimonas denitrificans]NIS03297.1 HAD family hydrolase [Gemmatimonadota bacterium]NIT69158.1 HAD family hydrolase [Gemmatimonadota bacterium]NIU54550.1 HAD hydrolase-like protein [Gemmatimonadota bacterium]
MTPKYAVLFDIDGTLLLSDSAGRVALHAALEAVYGTAGPIESYAFHGKTDPQIVLELMAAAGLVEVEIRRLMPSLWPLYLERLDHELGIRRRESRIRVLPGVLELLAELRTRPDLSMGLLTGNIEEGARRKLEAAGLAAGFGFGGYGSDSEDRPGIARVALERFRSSLRDGEDGATPVVVGDTPADVACARAVGGRAVAVATGRHSLRDLEECGADAVFEDFSDASGVVECILTLSGAGGSALGGAGANGGGR